MDISDRDYDADGRLVQRREGGRVWRYKWDALDRLIAVITPEREHWQYHYDGLGRRIAKQRVTMDGSRSSSGSSSPGTAAKSWNSR